MRATADRIDPIHLFFSSFGRLERVPFVLAMIPVVAAFAVFDLTANGWARTLTAWAVFLVLLFVASCLLSKRLHDLGRSGWWTAVILLAFLTAWPAPLGVIDDAALGVAVAATAFLSLWPGQRGANRFGPRRVDAVR